MKGHHLSGKAVVAGLALLATSVVPSALLDADRAAAARPQAQDAQNLVNQAVRIVDKMKRDPGLLRLMRRARGLYIVPNFGRGAFIVGGRGGTGLVVVRHAGRWTDPAFYNMGGISIGAQIGGSGGSIAFLLMSPGAVDAFRSGNKISLNAGAGLSIVNYSANSQASWGKGDIIMWSDTSGAFVGAEISATDINWDDGKNRSYYGRGVDVPQVLNGKAYNPGARRLLQVLPG